MVVAVVIIVIVVAVVGVVAVVVEKIVRREKMKYLKRGTLKLKYWRWDD